MPMIRTPIFHQRQQMEKMNGRLQHKRVQKLLRSGKKFVFIGDESCDMAVAVSRWCTYAKREICFEKSASDLKERAEELPEMIILESEKRAIGNDLKALKKMESQGVIVVFGCLENPELIQAIPKLMDFLGIKKSCC